MEAWTRDLRSITPAVCHGREAITSVPQFVRCATMGGFFNQHLGPGLGLSEARATCSSRTITVIVVSCRARVRHESLANGSRVWQRAPMHVRPTASHALGSGCQMSVPALRFQSPYALANTSRAALRYATAGQEPDAIGNVVVGCDRIACQKLRPECATTIVTGRVLCTSAAACSR